jgi:hypothetical protein
LADLVVAADVYQPSLAVIALSARPVLSNVSRLANPLASEGFQLAGSTMFERRCRTLADRITLRHQNVIAKFRAMDKMLVAQHCRNWRPPRWLPSKAAAGF